MKRALLALCLLLGACSPDKEAQFPIKADPAVVANVAASAKQALSIKVDPNRAFNMPAPIPEDQNVELKLTQAQIDRYAQRGIITAYADWCGFNAQNQSFLPFMIRERGKKELNDPNVGYAVLIHTLMMQRTRASLTGTCPDSMKRTVEKFTYKSVMDGIEPDLTDPGKL